MLKFYKDRKQLFECKVKLEGADLKEATPRLVLKNGSVSYTFDGKFDVLGNCKVDVPPLDEFNGKGGQAILEVRIGDVIFEPYKTRFEMSKQRVQIVGEAKVVKKTSVKTKQKDNKIIKEMLKAFNSIESKHKKTILEHIKFGYTPSDKVKKWAKDFFSDLSTKKAKIVMYEAENLFLNKDK